MPKYLYNANPLDILLKIYENNNWSFFKKDWWQILISEANYIFMLLRIVMKPS